MSTTGREGGTAAVDASGMVCSSAVFGRFAAGSSRDGFVSISRRQRMLPGEGSVWTRPRPSPSWRVADSPLARMRRAWFSAAGNQGVGLVPRLVTRSPAPSSNTDTSHCTRETANLSASASIPSRRHTARPICVEDAGSGSSPPSTVATSGMSPRASESDAGERGRRGSVGSGCRCLGLANVAVVRRTTTDITRC